MKLNTFPKVTILEATFPVNTHVYFPVHRRTIIMNANLTLGLRNKKCKA